MLIKFQTTARMFISSQLTQNIPVIQNDSQK